MHITFIGDLSLDINVVKGEPHELNGGGVLHAGITAHRLGAEVTVVTKCAAEDRPKFHTLGEAGVRTVYLDSLRSTSIRNDYPTDNPDDRISRAISKIDPFTAADLAHLRTDVLHVNPLWFGAFPCALLEEARRHTRLLGADAQGFLRHVEADGQMEHRDWAGKERYLPLLDVFKVDIKEAEILTGLKEPRPAAERLKEWGAKTVVLTHQSGVCVLDDRGFVEAPFGDYTIEGRTGRGDTCTAAFLVALGRYELAEAARFAARVTTEKMQYRGPYRGAA